MSNLITKQRKLNKLPYRYDDPELLSEQVMQVDKLYDFNNTRPSEQEKRQKLLKEIFAEIGENCIIQPPLNANCGCSNVHFGSGIYCNFNLTLLDDDDIYIGDNCFIAPNVTISTASHPIFPKLRENHYVFNYPVKIGNNVWIGSGSIIVAGVSIGDNSVVGCGSVVTKDIPTNVVAYGNPCRVVREIGEKDKLYYWKDKKLDVWE
jgi:galactoside O-acetyltransferase